MCVTASMHAEESKNRGQLIKPSDADLRSAERHDDAIAFVEHPVRQLAAQIRPLVRVDARQRLAAPERRDLQRAGEQWMPPIGNRRESQTVCRMWLLADLIKILWHDGLGMSLYAKRLERGRFIWPAPADGIVAVTPS